jgi:hypothetical protein
MVLGPARVLLALGEAREGLVRITASGARLAPHFVSKRAALEAPLYSKGRSWRAFSRRLVGATGDVVQTIQFNLARRLNHFVRGRAKSGAPTGFNCQRHIGSRHSAGAVASSPNQRIEPTR